MLSIQVLVDFDKVEYVRNIYSNITRISGHFETQTLIFG